MEINWWKRVLDSLWLFDDPEARLSYLNLLFTLLFAAIATFLWQKKERSKWSEFCTLSYWWNPSTKTDYLFFTFNAIMKGAFLLPLTHYTFELTASLLKILYQFPGSGILAPYTSLHLYFFTFFSFMLNDFGRFYQHWLMHKISWLWKFHRVHHSATILTPITLYRTHPVEVIMAFARNLFTMSLATSIFIFLTQKPVAGLDILGVNFLGYLFNLLGANLRHSHFFIGLGPLEYVLISPAQHQLHHSDSPKQFTKNLGVALSFWDQLFGTFLLSKNQTVLKFGLNKESK